MSTPLLAPPLRATPPVTAPVTAPVTRSRPGRLRLVPPLRTGAPRAPFVLLLGTLLVGGLVGLLVLHTALAEDSFRLHDLKVRSALLTDRGQALEQQVAAEAAPRRLAARAEAMGMVRSENPAFIRLSDGKVLGRPKAGVAPAVAPVAPAASAKPGDAKGKAGGTTTKATTARPRTSTKASTKAGTRPAKRGATPTAPSTGR